MFSPLLLPSPAQVWRAFVDSITVHNGAEGLSNHYLWVHLAYSLKRVGLGLLWGAAIGYLSLWGVYWLFKLLTGKEGLGYGDFKLLALIGAWGGWQVLPLTLVMSSVVGAVIGLCLLRLRRASMGSAMPFGPYLAIAGWIAVLWGDEMYVSYLQLFGH